jgi:SAM-dependent methyltransferase
MVQQDPAVSLETAAKKYVQFSNYLNFNPGPAPLPPTTARMLGLLEEFKVAPGRVYDVGAATGASLWHFRRAGWEVAGCEPSPNAVAQARHQREIALDLGTEDQHLPNQKDLTLVTSGHVLEHIYEPAASLRRIRSALASDGLLLLEVPCLTLPEFNPPGIFTPEHVNYFDEGSLMNLLEANGFAIRRAFITEHPLPYDFPVITLLAGKVEEGRPTQNCFDRNMEFLRQYTAHEQRKWDHVGMTIERSLAPHEPVFLWGAGWHTSNLLARTKLAAEHPVLGIGDRDAQKHGEMVGPYTVLPTAEVLAGAAPIVISSHQFESQIATDLEKQGVDSRRIVRPHSSQ